MSEDIPEKFIRKVSPLFTSGFKSMQTDEIMILDFLTAFPEEDQYIIASVALTKDVAENLITALSNFIKDDADGEN